MMTKETQKAVGFWTALIGTTLVHVGTSLGFTPAMLKGKPEPLKVDKENGAPDVYVSDRRWLLQRFERLEGTLSLVTDRLEAMERTQARRK